MENKDSSKTVHSEFSEREPLFELASWKFVADDKEITAMFMFDNGMGYNCVCRIVELLEAAGFIGPDQAGKPREVLVDLPTLEAMLKEE